MQKKWSSIIAPAAYKKALSFLTIAIFTLGVIEFAI